MNSKIKNIGYGLIFGLILAQRIIPSISIHECTQDQVRHHHLESQAISSDSDARKPGPLELEIWKLKLYVIRLES